MILTREMGITKRARANSLVLENHDFSAEPTVSMLLFPQDFGREVNLIFNLYINGVKRYQIRKPNGDGVLESLRMSPGRSTTVSLTLNSDVKVQELTENTVFGEGSEDDPYIITNYDDLLRMQQMLAADSQQGKHFMQVADISLGDSAWEPAENTFRGCYEGNGYTITVGPEGFSGENSGFFYSLGDEAEVKNLNIVCEQTSQTGGQSFGLLANQTLPGSLISNCHASGEFSGDKTGSQIYWGGLVGQSGGGIIDGSSFSGVIKGYINNSKGTMGGLVAEVTGPMVIINSYVSGTVANDPAANGNGKAFYLGGFIGRNDGADILNCYSRGLTYAKTRSANVGGFIGENVSGDIDNCYSLVDMTSVASGSGVKRYTFIADRQGGNITHSYDLTGADPLLPYPAWEEGDGEVTAAYIGVSGEVASLLDAYASGRSATLEGSVVEYYHWTLTRGGTALELVNNLEPVAN